MKKEYLDRLEFKIKKIKTNISFTYLDCSTKKVIRESEKLNKFIKHYIFISNG